MHIIRKILAYLSSQNKGHRLFLAGYLHALRNKKTATTLKEKRHRRYIEGYKAGLHDKELEAQSDH